VILEVVRLVARSRRASSLQVIEQCLRLLESRRVEAFSEPAVCGLEEVAGVVALALVEPEIS